MAVTVELPEDVEAALKMQALTRGLTTTDYVRELVTRDMEPHLDRKAKKKPLKSGYGMLAKFGPAPTDEEMEENRREMLRGFAEKF